MTRFNPRIGAIVLVSVAAIYMVAALVTRHSAASEPPPDLSAREASIDVWRALALVAPAPAGVLLADVRPAEQYLWFHAPRSISLPGAGSRALARAAGGKPIVVIASSDEQGAKLAGELRKLRGLKHAHFLSDGIRAWYLSLDLPVPVFNDKPPPRGYHDALARVQKWIRGGFAGEDPAQVTRALQTLAQAGYAPTALQSKAKPKAAGTKKKIAGGCG